MRKIYLNKLAYFATIVLLASCSSNKIVPQKPHVYKQPSPQMINDNVPKYKLGYGDVIEVKFFNNERFNEIVTVRPDGFISLERIGDILVAGMTPSMLDTLITKTYSEIVVEPDVTIFVRSFGGSNFYVLGEVNAPGSYALQQNMNLIQAIAMAGDVKGTAKLGSVMILRADFEGNIEALKFNLSKSLKKDSKINVADFQIHAQDVIYVPRTLIANVNVFLDQVLNGLLPPIQAYMSALWWLRR